MWTLPRLILSYPFFFLLLFFSFPLFFSGVVLFATDLAARGLDFPGVDWVRFLIMLTLLMLYYTSPYIYEHCVCFFLVFLLSSFFFFLLFKVIQVDCPEDVQTYIHRVGRTARFKKTGRSLLLLTPSEIKFQDLLEKANIPIEKISINPDKLSATSLSSQFASHAAQDPDFKYLVRGIPSHSITM